MYVCASTNACAIELQFIQQEHRVEVEWNVRGLCPWVLYEYMCLPLYQCQEIYCWRYLWATNSPCTGPWIDTAAVQSKELQALLGDKASWSASEILLLNLKIPPFSTVCLCCFSICFVLWLCMSSSINSPWRKQLQFVRSMWIYAEVTHLRLCLLKQRANRITVIIWIHVESKICHLCDWLQ